MAGVGIRHVTPPSLSALFATWISDKDGGGGVASALVGRLCATLFSFFRVGVVLVGGAAVRDVVMAAVRFVTTAPQARGALKEKKVGGACSCPRTGFGL